MLIIIIYLNYKLNILFQGNKKWMSAFLIVCLIYLLFIRRRSGEINFFNNRIQSILIHINQINYKSILKINFNFMSIIISDIVFRSVVLFWIVWRKMRCLVILFCCLTSALALIQYQWYENRVYENMYGRHEPGMSARRRNYM